MVLGCNLNGDQASGSINGSLGTNFGYDYDDQSVSMTKSGTSVSYAYDAIGHQLSKNVNETLTIYCFDGGQVVEEKTTGGTLSAQYLWGSDLVRCNGGYPPTHRRHRFRPALNVRIITEIDGEIMSEQVARRFIDALWALEETKDARPLTALYAENALVGNVVAPEQYHGPEGAKKFWTEYRGTFDAAKSEFRSVIAADGHVALEWTTKGTGFNGSPLEYSGVTILDIEGDKVTRSSAYFNPKALGRQLGVK